jgi:hypothetical protein
MITNPITDRPTGRAAALAACLGLLFAGATACGTEHAATPTKTGGRPASLSSNDLIKKENANQQAYLRQLEARRPHAELTSHGFGDDRRQQQPLRPSRGYPGAHH